MYARGVCVRARCVHCYRSARCIAPPKASSSSTKQKKNSYHGTKPSLCLVIERRRRSVRRFRYPSSGDRSNHSASVPSPPPSSEVSSARVLLRQNSTPPPSSFRRAPIRHLEALLPSGDGGQATQVIPFTSSTLFLPPFHSFSRTEELVEPDPKVRYSSTLLLQIEIENVS
jgi:hypothetical protein